ncbi:hypothetical protein V1525DRAFT_2188 [Lipomyces kononenkoae]|uniref:Uncharacterized protein n=1 Tax=Lipomyces kononenkoae TaxID=34357 RepID=A0ACC3TB87_LIPKO
MSLLNESPTQLSLSSDVSALTSSQTTQPQTHRPTPTRSCPPGPIPAAPPALVRRDEHGVDWIAFQYSKDRVRTEYCIRCDVESIDLTKMSKIFRKLNCIYPRADVPETNYLGNRHRYENECNRIGWALAHLNPSLRGKRGLIQRAVDSWRNSNADPKVRSRRVRRLSKQKQKQQQQRRLSIDQDQDLVDPRTSVGRSTGSASDMTLAMMQTNSDTYGPSSLPPQLQQSMETSELKYEDPGSNLLVARTLSTSSASSSSPSPPVTLIRSLPMSLEPLTFNFATADIINPLQYPTSLVTLDECSNGKSPYLDADTDPIPDCGHPRKSLKYIILDNDPTIATSSRLRVRVTINDADLEQVPDKYRLDHAVFPRTVIASLSTHFRHHGVQASQFEDEERLKLDKAINEIGIKMAWLQPRLFEGRMQFLQRAIDTYRCKLVHVGGGAEFAVRKGKTKWRARIENPNQPRK